MKTITATAGLMLLAAVTLAAASIIHFGLVIRLGFVTINDPFAGARLPEAIIAVVVAAGAFSLLAGWRGAWWFALVSILFGIVGVIVGLRAVLFSGPVTRPGDLVYHGGLMVLLLLALGLLSARDTRRALRKPA